MPSTCTYLHLPPHSAPPALPPTRFRAVIIAEQVVTPHWQAQIASWLVQSGCLYMMAWGPGCSSWDDAVDAANTEAFDFGEIPDDRFVMTTWHEHDPLKKVFWFAKHNAHHQTVKLEHTMLVHIAASADSAALRLAFGEA